MPHSTPLTLIAQTRAASSGVTSVIGPTSAIPALLTMMSKPSSAAAAWSTAANTCSRSLTSATNVVAFEPSSADLVGYGVDAVGPDVDEGDVGAVAGQPQRYTAADAPAAAGDHGDLAGQW